MTIIDGKNLAFEILKNLKKRKMPSLSIAVVLVGRDPASMSFLKQKAEAAKFLGIDFEVFLFPKNIGAAELRGEISKLNRSKSIGGIIIQLPLPKHINRDLMLNAISPDKDVDALSEKAKVLAPTAEAVKIIFKKYKINFQNKKILIVGRGELVGGPIFNWLSKIAKKVEIVDETQKDILSLYTRRADIIITGVGKAKLINGVMIKRDAVLIDFGFEKKADQIFGDFDFQSAKKKAKLITPVPGGMGPMSVAMIFKNFLKLHK